MHMRSICAALFAASLLSGAAAVPAAPISRDAVVDETLAQLRQRYVFPEKLDAIARNVRQHQQAGEYAAAADDKVFAELLTAHLREVSHDKHMSVTWRKDARAARPRASTAQRHDNHGFRQVEILPGNIGYMDIAYFHPDASQSGATVASAMATLAGTDAIIIDLRSNGGGGNTNHLLASYFVKGPAVLVELRFRGQAPRRILTHEVPGKTYLDRPVYVLTSGRTASAAEGFAFALKNRKRATLVGATTAGAGNPNTTVPIGSDYLVSIPIGQALDPATGTGWEGAGVEPDVAVDEKAALEVALRMALEQRERQPARPPAL